MTVLEKYIERGLIPKSVEELDLGKNKGIFVKIGIVSETTGYLIIRNNDATETTSEEFYGEERVVIPGSKWRGAERSFALALLRKVDGIIPKEYSRNAVIRKDLIISNPLSILFGDSSIGEGQEMLSIASRIYYDWSYSYESLGKITERLTHNSLSDSGAILTDESGKVQSNALYNIQYIKPGVKFIRFITLENVSKEFIDLAAMTITGTTRYGARTAILGYNVFNKILGIGFAKGDKPISSYSIMSQAWQKEDYNPEELIIESMKTNYGENLLKSDELQQYLNEIKETYQDNQKLKESMERIMNKAKSDWSRLLTKDRKRKGASENESSQT